MNQTLNGHKRNRTALTQSETNQSTPVTGREVTDEKSISALPLPPLNQEKELSWWALPLSPLANQSQATQAEVNKLENVLTAKAPLHAWHVIRGMNRALQETEFCIKEAQSLREQLRQRKEDNKPAIAVIDDLLKRLQDQSLKKQQELHKAETALAAAASKAFLVITDPLTTNAEVIQKVLESRAPKHLHVAGEKGHVPGRKHQDKAAIDKLKELITSLLAPAANALFLATSLGTYLKMFNVRELRSPSTFLYIVLSASIALGLGVEFCIGVSAEHLAAMRVRQNEQTDGGSGVRWEFASAVAMYVGLFVLLTIVEGFGLRQMVTQLAGQTSLSAAAPLYVYCLLAAAIPGSYVYSRYRSKYNDLKTSISYAAQSHLLQGAEDKFMKDTRYTNLIACAYAVPIAREQLKTINDKITDLTDEREKLVNPQLDEAILKLHADHIVSTRGAHIDAMRAAYKISEVLEPLSPVTPQ